MEHYTVYSDPVFLICTVKNSSPPVHPVPGKSLAEFALGHLSDDGWGTEGFLMIAAQFCFVNAGLSKQQHISGESVYE